MAPLPRSGFVVGRHNNVVFVALDGRVLDRLVGFEVVGNVDNRGVWLQRGRDHFRLDPQSATVEPIARSFARKRIYGGEPVPHLPVPPGGRYRGMTVGRWNYVIPGPATASLAQWSGECELPTAFWAEGSEVVVLATGEARLGAPSRSHWGGTMTKRRSPI